ncbi:hypothetical protein FKM82_017026 [Ascaphus truei]
MVLSLCPSDWNDGSMHVGILAAQIDCLYHSNCCNVGVCPAVLGLEMQFLCITAMPGLVSILPFRTLVCILYAGTTIPSLFSSSWYCVYQ